MKDKILLIDSDGVRSTVSPRKEEAQIKMIFNVLLHYSEADSIVNGHRVKIIRYNVLTHKEDTILNTLRLRFYKNGLSYGQFDLLVELYKKVITDIGL